MSRYQFFILMLCVCKVFCQNKNSLNYERSYNTNADVVSTVKDELKLELGFKKGFSLFSSYSNTRIDLLNPLGDFNQKDIENLYSFDIGIKKQVHLKENLNLNLVLNPQIRTNEFDYINGASFNFNSSLILEKKFTPKSKLNIGLEYGTLFGKSSIYPVFDYNYSFNNQFHLNIGFPKTNLKFNWFTKNNLILAVEYDSYYSSITNSYSRVKNNMLLEYNSLFIDKTQTSLSYNYTFFNSSIINFSIGKSFNNTLKIKENNNEVSDYSFNNNLIISMGIKYNLNK